MKLPLETETKKQIEFLNFCNQTSPISWSYDASHLKLIAKHLHEMEVGLNDRLGIFLPPRHAKTETVTVRKAAHLIEQAEYSGTPIQILITAHTDRLAKRFSRKIRAIIQARIGLSTDKTDASEWETPGGSLLMARGVGSVPTGTGFNWIFIDDPIKSRDEAESEVYREKMHDWYEDIYTRLEPNGKIVLTLTRWHHDDVATRAIATEPLKWKIISFPAIAQEEDILGRKEGDALWEERFDIEALLRIKSVMTREHGASTWESLYQQNPTPREGTMFKVSMIEIVDAAPVQVWGRCRAWDNGATKDDGAYSAGVKLAGPDMDGIYYIVHVKRGRWDSNERNKTQRQTAMMDGVNTKVRGPQDPGAAGKESAGAFVSNMAGFSVITRPVTGDKVLRAEPYSAQVNAGNVKMVKDTEDDRWNKDYLEELRQFPRGKYKDQVDASADAFSELAFYHESEEIFEYDEPVRISAF